MPPPKTEERKGEKPNLGTATSANPASWHTDGEGLAGIFVHVFLKPRKCTPPMPALDGSYRKCWPI